ncbi:flagellar motor switch protein FliN [Weissella cibaria]|nr:flagellar motor switch protein FliN [Weissella cibaria]
MGKETLGENNHTFGLLADVELEVTVELGRRRLPLADILRLTNGSVIELEKLVGEPLDIYANGRFIPEGEAVVIDDQFGIRITSLASTRNRDKVFH